MLLGKYNDKNIYGGTVMTDESITNISMTKQCPFCAEEIQAEAIICRYCGRDMPKEKKKKSPLLPLLLIILVIIIVVGGGSGWYYFYGPCGVKLVKESTIEMDEINNDWISAVELASSTSRINLSGPVSNLQNIKKQVSDLDVPACMLESQVYLYSAVDYSIDAFFAFMGEESDTVVGNKFDTSVTYIERYRKAIVEVNNCAPFCEIDDNYQKP